MQDACRGARVGGAREKAGFGAEVPCAHTGADGRAGKSVRFRPISAGDIHFHRMHHLRRERRALSREVVQVGAAGGEDLGREGVVLSLEYKVEFAQKVGLSQVGSAVASQRESHREPGIVQPVSTRFMHGCRCQMRQNLQAMCRQVSTADSHRDEQECLAM